MAAVRDQEAAAMVVDEAQMTLLAKQLAGQIEAPCVIYLEGDLGAGKTTFARALIQALGYLGTVKSPTYGLLEWYQLERLCVLHLDLYRIESPEEIEYLGIEDLFDKQSILIAEWPEKGGVALPDADLIIKLSHAGDRRNIEIKPPLVR